MQDRHNDGDAVRIKKPTLREHGATGTVKSYDDTTQWYWVELDQGPPWRGMYKHAELERLNNGAYCAGILSCVVPWLGCGTLRFLFSVPESWAIADCFREGEKP
jgi:hypothetical protein